MSPCRICIEICTLGFDAHLSSVLSAQLSNTIDYILVRPWLGTNNNVPVRQVFKYVGFGQSF